MKTINDFNTNTICISKSLIHLKSRIKNKYNLEDYNKNSLEPCLFFGIYTVEDIDNIHQYNGLIYVMPGGSDLLMLQRIRKKYKCFFISENIKERYYFMLENNYKYIKNVFYDMIYLNLVDTKLFKPINSPLELGKKIYIYDGRSDCIKSANDIYNSYLINKIKNKLPNFNYIHSKDNLIPYELMPNVYRRCFIGLRLTISDGNANTVQEFKEMNIPIIHNHSDYGIKWSSDDDIIKTILKYDKFINTIKRDHRE